jgi:hypothetical protein
MSSRPKKTKFVSDDEDDSALPSYITGAYSDSDDANSDEEESSSSGSSESVESGSTSTSGSESGSEGESDDEFPSSSKFVTPNYVTPAPSRSTPYALPTSTLPTSSLPTRTLPTSGSAFPQVRAPLPTSTFAMPAPLPPLQPITSLPQSAQQSTLPQSTLPQSTLPQSTLPQSAFPQPTLPQSAFPQSTVTQLPSIKKGPTPEEIATLVAKMPGITLVGTPSEKIDNASIDVIMHKAEGESDVDYIARKALVDKLSTIPDLPLNLITAYQLGSMLFQKAKLGITYAPELEETLSYIVGLLKR